MGRRERSSVSGADRALTQILRHPLPDCPGQISCIGDSKLLKAPLLGVLCSQRCPGDIILKAFDAMRALRDDGVAIAGGFHSPMEKECLDILMRGRQPIVVCPARGVENMRVPRVWREPIATGRLAIVSPFAASLRRPTKDSARERNAFLAALASDLLVLHASPGGEVEALCHDLLHSGRRVYALPSEANAALLRAGAVHISTVSP